MSSKSKKKKNLKIHSRHIIFAQKYGHILNFLLEKKYLSVWKNYTTIMLSVIRSLLLCLNVKNSELLGLMFSYISTYLNTWLKIVIKGTSLVVLIIISSAVTSLVDNEITQFQLTCASDSVNTKSVLDSSKTPNVELLALFEFFVCLLNILLQLVTLMLFACPSSSCVSSPLITR